MNILFTLCGRAGSKGVKGKNVRDFLDIPLAWFSLAGIALYIKNNAKQGDRMDIALNTDSEDLIQIIQRVKDLNVMLLRRDESLGGDRVPKVSVILDCLTRAEKEAAIHYDMVVDLDITSPLRTVNDIKHAVERKRERSEVDVVFSVTGARRNPYFNMVKEENGFFTKALAATFTTRQECPAFFDMNASIYAYSPKALREKDHPSFFNTNCDAVLMKDTGILDIDSEEDYELMQVIAKYFVENLQEYKEIYEYAKEWL
jgi:CMP-N,N'-diacetyllegionaminic acid synthase